MFLFFLNKEGFWKPKMQRQKEEKKRRMKKSKIDRGILKER